MGFMVLNFGMCFSALNVRPFSTKVHRQISFSLKRFS